MDADHGVIVGFGGNAAGTNQFFIGNDVRGYQRLIVPCGDAPNSTVCEGINNSGHVVCGASDPTFNTIGEFIGTPDGEDGD